MPKNKVSKLDYWKQQLMMCEQLPDQMMAVNGWTVEELEEEIAYLKKKIGHSTQGTASRRKGANYENVIAKKIYESWGIRLVRTPMSGGFQKSQENDSMRGDLSCLDKTINFKLSPECKKQKTWNLRDWFKQAKEDAPEGKIPIVFFHDFQKIQDGKVVRKAEDYVMLRTEDFLNIIAQDKIIEKKEGMKRNGKSGTRKKISGGSKGIIRSKNRKTPTTKIKRNGFSKRTK